MPFQPNSCSFELAAAGSISGLNSQIFDKSRRKGGASLGSTPCWLRRSRRILWILSIKDRSAEQMLKGRATIPHNGLTARASNNHKAPKRKDSQLGAGPGLLNSRVQSPPVKRIITSQFRFNGCRPWRPRCELPYPVA